MGGEKRVQVFCWIIY